MTQKDKMTNPDNDEKMEQLAAIEHERWADWQKHMHAKITPSADDGICLIGEEWVRRWEKQIKTPYSELTEQEKESDREQVRRYWHLIVELQQQSHAAGYKEGSRETAEEILDYIVNNLEYNMAGVVNASVDYVVKQLRQKYQGEG